MISGSSNHERRQLSGNGMMLQQMAGWFLYICGHTVRREFLETFAPPVKSWAMSKDPVDDKDSDEDYDGLSDMSS